MITYNSIHNPYVQANLEAIKEFKTSLGLNTKIIAERLDISPLFFESIEEGKKQTTLKIMEELANIFHCELEDILHSSESKYFKPKLVEQLASENSSLKEYLEKLKEIDLEHNQLEIRREKAIQEAKRNNDKLKAEIEALEIKLGLNVSVKIEEQHYKPSKTYSKITKEQALHLAKGFTRRWEFAQHHKGAYNLLLKLKLMHIAFPVTIAAHNPRHSVGKISRIPKQEFYDEARKYTTKKEFREKNRSFHDYAYIKGFLDEICSHMVRATRFKYTFKELVQIASDCKTWKEFRTANRRAYTYAYNRNLLEKLQDHVNTKYKK